MPRLSDVFLKADKVESVTSTLSIGGIDFIVRSTLNKDYQKAIKNPPKDADDDDYYVRAASEHVLKSWSGLLDDDFNEIEPTEENKFNVLKDYTEIASRILIHAQNTKNFIGDKVDQEIKN